MRLHEFLQAHKFRRTTLINISALMVLAGVGLSRTHYALSGDGVLLAAAFTLVSFRSRKVFALLCVALLGLSIGWWRGSIYMNKAALYQSLSGQKVTIVGTAQDDGVYGQNSQLTFPISNNTIASNGQHLTGTIQASGFGEAAIYRGDMVQVSGKLFPTRGNNQATIAYAQLHVLKRSSSLVDAIRRKFVAGIQTALPEPLASFGLGLLIGQRNTLPSNVSQQLTAVGLTHIIAVSGYNLTILVEATRRLLGKRSKRQTMIMSLLLIAGFLLIAGSSASITRAALVSVLSLAAWFYGREVKPLVLLTLSAATTAAFNPFYEWSNVGWYLSFLAFFGVLVLAPLVQSRLFKAKRPSLLVSIIIETLCAEIMTIPIVLYIFGQVSLIALPANGLVVAFVPFAMLLATIAGVGGMLVPWIAGWLAWPAKLLLTYMLDMVSLFARIPQSFVQRLSLPLAEMLGLYALVLAVVWLLWQKAKKSASITDRKTDKGQMERQRVRSQQMVNN